MFDKTLRLVRRLTARPAIGPALLAATALGLAGALLPYDARAETTSTNTLQTAAATEPGAADEAPGGFRAKMRERFKDRMQERKKEFEDAHPAIDKKLTPDQIRDIVAGRLAMSGNSNLKVGKVTAKADGIVAVEIITKTGAVADVRDISTKTGFPANADARAAHHMMGGLMDGGGMARRHAAHGAGDIPGDIRERLRDHAPDVEKRDLALTVDQARKLAEARLIMTGNKNLKVGAVKERDPDTITVDIVAADNSLVVQRSINRHTGRPLRNG